MSRSAAQRRGDDASVVVEETLSLRDRHRAATRLRIIDAATHLFIEHGFDVTTVDQIAAAADVSPRTFFRYFPTKEAVLFHDVDARMDRFAEMLAERPATEPSAVALVQVLCSMIDEIQREERQLELIAKVKADGLGEHGPRRAAVEENGLRLVLATLATRAGAVPDDLGLRAAVAVVTACFDLALAAWIDEDPRPPFRQVFSAVLAAGDQHLGGAVGALDGPRSGSTT